MKKSKAKNRVEISANERTGAVFVLAINADDVTGEEIDQAKKDYWDKCKKHAAIRAKAMHAFDAEYLVKKGN